MSAFDYELGDLVKDKITGFVGRVVQASEWLNGCNTYLVQSPELKNGVPADEVFFDEPQLTPEDLRPGPRRTPFWVYHLGDKVRDKVTNFNGVIIHRTLTYADNIYGVQSTELQDGVPIKHQNMYEGRLALVTPVNSDPSLYPDETGGPEKNTSIPL